MTTVNLDILNAAKRMGASDEDAGLFAAEIARVNPDQLATRSDIIELKGELTLVKWMLGFVLAAGIAVLFMVFKILAKMATI